MVVVDWPDTGGASLAGGASAARAGARAAAGARPAAIQQVGGGFSFVSYATINVSLDFSQASGGRNVTVSISYVDPSTNAVVRPEPTC